MENNQSHKPTLDYWHVWTDRDGISHQSRCQIQDFIEKGIAPDTSPQWLSKLKQSGATITFTVLPVGWVGNWHENPKATVGNPSIGTLVCGDYGRPASRDGPWRDFIWRRPGNESGRAR
jgi:hypothetical protein